MNRETVTTALLVVACLAMGFVFGVEVTGRLAMQMVADAPLAVDASWLETAKRLRWGAIGVFGVSAMGATYLYERANTAK